MKLICWLQSSSYWTHVLIIRIHAGRFHLPCEEGEGGDMEFSAWDLATPMKAV